MLDTVTICPPQLGQKAALWGLRNLADWVAGERAEILRRRAAVVAALAALPGWRVLGCGAYFAYVEHPHPLASDELAPLLVREHSLLMLPGTMFAPARPGRRRRGGRQLRIAFANVGVEGLRSSASGWRRWGRSLPRPCSSANPTSCGGQKPIRPSCHPCEEPCLRCLTLAQCSSGGSKVRSIGLREFP